MNDHDLLIRIDERTEQTNKDLNNLTSCLKTNESRLTNLENWKSKTIGFVISVPIIIPIIFFFVTN